jgi:hypothetical protein
MPDRPDVIVTVGSPNWVVRAYAQEEMSVLEALRRMAQQLGWDIRWFPSEIGSLRFYDPAALRDDVDASFSSDRYADITELAWGDEDVRNYWQGWYESPDDGSPVGPFAQYDADSIDRYGLRYARIYLDRASNISDADEMNRFLAAALRDSKDPFASHKVTMPLWPAVELNDRYTYLANGEEYNRDLTGAVVAYTHHWDSTPGSMPTTTISIRTHPMAAYREYRRSVAPKALISLAAPTTEYAPERTIWLQVESLSPP